MTGPERGCLLLTCSMGDVSRKILTSSQFRTLALRMSDVPRPEEDRDLQWEDLRALGYSRDMGERILNLLAEEERLDWYLRAGRKQGCIPITRVSARYPDVLRQKLGWDAPACLWARGDLSLLETVAISLVGSRELREENRRFAEAVGVFSAEQGLTLLSGNARGADRTAQDACLRSGGRVISIVADELNRQSVKDGVLYLSEDSFDAPFTTRRALSRNRCIHAMGGMVFVAQAENGRGGTWNGTVQNLRNQWTQVFCLHDGSEAENALTSLGANAISLADIEKLRDP